MYKTVAQTVSYLQKLEANTNDISKEEIQLFIIPSYTTLESACKAIDHNNIMLGDRKSVRVGKECRSRWSPYH